MLIKILKRGVVMKIAIGADHAGFELKEQLRNFLINSGYEIEDFDKEIHTEFRKAQIRFLDELKFHEERLKKEIRRVVDSIDHKYWDMVLR